MIRYYVTDRRQGDVLTYARHAIAAGVDMIQIREKDLPARELFELVCQVRDLAAGTPTREVWRGKKRRLKTADPQAHHRFPVERTNAWLKAKRRIATRRDRKADNYLAFLHLGMILILTRSF